MLDQISKGFGHKFTLLTSRLDDMDTSIQQLIEPTNRPTIQPTDQDESGKGKAKKKTNTQVCIQQRILDELIDLKNIMIRREKRDEEDRNK